MENSAAPAEDASHGMVPKAHHRWEFVEHTHEYLNEFVRSSDQKAAFLLVAGTALFGLLYREPAAGDCLKWIRLTALPLTAISVALSAWTVKPRQQDEKNGLVAWEGIRARKTSYWDTIRALNDEQLVGEVSNHCERLAEILHDKYKWLNRAVWFFLAGGLISAVFFITLHLQRPAAGR